MFDSVNNCPYLYKLSEKEKDISYVIESELSKDTEHEFYSLSEINKIISKNIDNYTLKELTNVLVYLSSISGSMIHKDYLSKESEYKLLDRYYQLSSLSEHYTDLKIGSDSVRILLISDTHIGNNNLEDLELISETYNFALNDKIEVVFHLGDVFEGLSKINENQILEEYKRQIDLFIEKYPNNIRTISLLGNHDRTMHELYQRRVHPSFDLRTLSYYKDKFTLLPRSYLTLNDKPIHFSHRLYLNTLIRDIKINKIDDILEYESLFSYENKINISGHLHNGFIYRINDNDLNESIYIGVPSLNKLNKNAIALELIMDGNNINLIPIYKENNRLLKKDNYTWNIEEKNKLIRKMI